MNQTTTSTHEPTRVSVDDAKSMLDRGWQPVFIDTRNPTAWASSHEKLPGALRVPTNEIDQYLHEIPHGQPIITYCT